MSLIKLNNAAEIEARPATARVEPERVAEVNVSQQKGNANAPKTTDSVSVSERGAALGELAAKAENLPDVRQEKIDQLRSQVQSGNYRPAAADIADAMLKDEKGSTGTI